MALAAVPGSRRGTTIADLSAGVMAEAPSAAIERSVPWLGGVLATRRRSDER